MFINFRQRKTQVTINLRIDSCLTGSIMAEKIPDINIAPCSVPVNILLSMWSFVAAFYRYNFIYIYFSFPSFFLTSALIHIE